MYSFIHSHYGYIKVDRTLDIKEMGNAIRKFATMRLIIRLMSIHMRYTHTHTHGYREYFREGCEIFHTENVCITFASHIIHLLHGRR